MKDSKTEINPNDVARPDFLRKVSFAITKFNSSIGATISREDLDVAEAFVDYFLKAEKIDLVMAENLSKVVELFMALKFYVDKENTTRMVAAPAASDGASPKALEEGTPLIASMSSKDEIFTRCSDLLKKFDAMGELIFKGLLSEILGDEKYAVKFMYSLEKIKIFLPLLETQLLQGRLNNLQQYKKIFNIWNGVLAKNPNYDANVKQKIRDLVPVFNSQDKVLYLGQPFIKFLNNRKPDALKGVSVALLSNPIPNDIMLEIFSQLDLAGIKRVSLVCKSWNTLVKNLSLEQYVKISGRSPQNKNNVFFSFDEIPDFNEKISEIESCVIQKLDQKQVGKVLPALAQNYDFLKKEMWQHEGSTLRTSRRRWLLAALVFLPAILVPIIVASIQNDREPIFIGLSIDLLLLLLLFVIDNNILKGRFSEWLGSQGYLKEKKLETIEKVNTTHTFFSPAVLAAEKSQLVTIEEIKETEEVETHTVSANDNDPSGDKNAVVDDEVEFGLRRPCLRAV